MSRVTIDPDRYFQPSGKEDHPHVDDKPGQTRAQLEPHRHDSAQPGEASSKIRPMSRLGSFPHLEAVEICEASRCRKGCGMLSFLRPDTFV